MTEIYRNYIRDWRELRRRKRRMNMKKGSGMMRKLKIKVKLQESRVLEIRYEMIKIKIVKIRR